jgi:hypothetical protein
MHHIIGGFILGAAFGQTTRTTIWRPLLRNAIKGGIVAARGAKSMGAAVSSEARSIYAEAQSELGRSAPSQSSTESAKPRPGKPAKKED